MFKRWLDLKSNGNGSAARNGCAEHALATLELEESGTPSRMPALAGAERPAPEPDNSPGLYPVCRSLSPNGPELAFGIGKVIEMAHSPHLAGLSPEARRCAVSMALEAVGAEAEDLLQDALLRQRSLNDLEKENQDKLRRFEERKAEENRKLQSELDALTADFMSRMQANLDDVAREQDRFRDWQRKKQQETQQIADAAAFCVPEGMGSHGGSLTAMLERACSARR